MMGGVVTINRYRVRYKVCEGGMERMGVVLAKDYTRARGVALRTYQVVLKVTALEIPDIKPLY